MEIKNLRNEISSKNEQIALLEKQIADSVVASQGKVDSPKVSQVNLSDLNHYCGCFTIIEVHSEFVFGDAVSYRTVGRIK